MKGVYYIRCKVNNKIYIGSSVNIDKRFLQHFVSLTDKKHHNKFLQYDFNIHGNDNFEYKVLEEVDKSISREDLYKVEQKWLDLTSNKYNILSKATPLGKDIINKPKKKPSARKKKRRNPAGKRAKAFRNMYAR